MPSTTVSATMSMRSEALQRRSDRSGTLIQRPVQGSLRGTETSTVGFLRAGGRQGFHGAQRKGPQVTLSRIEAHCPEEVTVTSEGLPTSRNREKGILTERNLAEEVMLKYDWDNIGFLLLL